VFARLLGEEVRSLEPALEQFYTEEFNAVRAILRERRELSSLMGSLREKGYTLVLATNPIFPAVAVATRMSWVGLAPEDFDYVTTYENSTYSKPDPAYYREILEKVEKKPEQCLMVGNNPTDDGAAALLGMELRIVTDYLENERGLDLGPFICRTFREMEEELLTLPSVK